jgi:hypothetical protein
MIRGALGFEDLSSSVAVKKPLQRLSKKEKLLVRWLYAKILSHVSDQEQVLIRNCRLGDRPLWGSSSRSSY